MPIGLGFGVMVGGIGGAGGFVGLTYISEVGAAATYFVPDSLIVFEGSDTITINIPDAQILDETASTITIEA